MATGSQLILLSLSLFICKMGIIMTVLPLSQVVFEYHVSSRMWTVCKLWCTTQMLEGWEGRKGRQEADHVTSCCWMVKNRALNEWDTGQVNVDECTWRVVLICSGCHNKIPQTGWLKQQTLISHTSGGWEVLDQVAGRFCSWWGPTYCLADDCPLTVSSQGGESELWCLFLFL